MTRPKLSARQREFLRASGHDPRDGNGYGLELVGAGNWQTARSLERLGLGWIEGGAPQGSELPGMFFANREGVALVADDSDDEGWGE